MYCPKCYKSKYINNIQITELRFYKADNIYTREIGIRNVY